jgi:predicted metal-dependent hydrolase
MGDVSHHPYLEGIKLFNSANFFEAHEVLEDVWRPARNPERKFLQSLIQVAVALHHHSRGNLVGARSLLARATRNLEPYPEKFGGVDLRVLRKSLQRWSKALAESRPAPPHFKIKVQARNENRRGRGGRRV